MSILIENFSENTPLVKGEEFRAISRSSLIYKRENLGYMQRAVDSLWYYTGNHRLSAAHRLFDLFNKISPFNGSFLNITEIQDKIVYNFGEYDSHFMGSDEIIQIYKSCLKTHFVYLKSRFDLNKSSTEEKLQLIECYLYGYGVEKSVESSKEIALSIKEITELQGGFFGDKHKNTEKYFTLVREIFIFSEPLLSDICRNAIDYTADGSRCLNLFRRGVDLLDKAARGDLNISDSDYQGVTHLVQQRLFERLYEKYKSETESFLAELLFCFKDHPPKKFSDFYLLKSILEGDVTTDLKGINLEYLPKFLKSFFLFATEEFKEEDLKTLISAYTNGLELETVTIEPNIYCIEYFSDYMNEFAARKKDKSHFINFLKIKQALLDNNPSALREIQIYLNSFRYSFGYLKAYIKDKLNQELEIRDLSCILMCQQDSANCRLLLQKYLTRLELEASSSNSNFDYFFQGGLECIRKVRYIYALHLFYGIGGEENIEEALSLLCNADFIFSPNSVENLTEMIKFSHILKLLDQNKNFLEDLELYLIEKIQTPELDKKQLEKYFDLFKNLYLEKPLLKQLVMCCRELGSIDLFLKGREILLSENFSQQAQLAKILLKQPSFEDLPTELKLHFRVLSGEGIDQQSMDSLIGFIRFHDAYEDVISSYEWVAESCDKTIFYHCGRLAYLNFKPDRSLFFFKRYIESIKSPNSKAFAYLAILEDESDLSSNYCLQFIQSTEELTTPSEFWDIYEKSTCSKSDRSIPHYIRAIGKTNSKNLPIARTGAHALHEIMAGRINSTSLEKWRYFESNIDQQFWKEFPQDLRMHLHYLVTGENSVEYGKVLLLGSEFFAPNQSEAIEIFKACNPSASKWYEIAWSTDSYFAYFEAAKQGHIKAAYHCFQKNNFEEVEKTLESSQDVLSIGQKEAFCSIAVRLLEFNMDTASDQDAQSLIQDIEATQILDGNQGPFMEKLCFKGKSLMHKFSNRGEVNQSPLKGIYLKEMPLRI